ncbi:MULTISPECIES: hypothetical protein [unclassified Microcoleus]|uniref:hypothetical protein n=1 Tax=unclassified Microcoleus TaxID=2642155 RepID=UPI002FD0F257
MRRFSRLQFALKMLNGQAPPAGSPLANYLQFKNGNPEFAPKPAAGEVEPRGGVIVRGINPFGKPIGGTDNPNSQKVKISGRAFPQVATVGLDATGTSGDNNLNLLDTFANSGGFVPAKITVFTGAIANVNANKLSSITRVNYRKQNGNSYTFPFGSTGTAPNNHEQTKANVLAGVIATRDAGDTANIYRASFTPERFLRN